MNRKNTHKFFFYYLCYAYSLKNFSKSCSESDGSSLSIDEPDGCYTPDDNSGFPTKSYK